MILHTNVSILKDASPEEVHSPLDWINHATDAPILVAAGRAKVDFSTPSGAPEGAVTLNTRHFIEDVNVSRRCGLRIGTPGDALAWARQQLSK